MVDYGTADHIISPCKVNRARGMCGIIGIISDQPITQKLLSALKKLDYRGYDSLGIGLLTPQTQEIAYLKTIETVASLSKELDEHSTLLQSTIGIGHTRWATHGKPSLLNAHPQGTERVAVVHNGIIENNVELRKFLEAKGCKFHSQTDTEVVPKMISLYIEEGSSIEEAIEATVAQLEGKFSLVLLFAERPDLLVAIKRGSPLMMGWGNGLVSIASDAYTIAPLTNRIAYLENGDTAFMRLDGIRIYNNGKQVERPLIDRVLTTEPNSEKGGFPNFMLKEIHETPFAVQQTIQQICRNGMKSMIADLDESVIATLELITIVACGSSYFAGHIAKHWIESTSGVLTILENSSEFRYKQHISRKNELFICISQSGETADTIEALESAKKQGIKTLGIVNTRESTISRTADHVIYTQAGQEISVASTKTFATQLAILYCLAIGISEIKQKALPSGFSHCLDEIVNHIQNVLSIDKELDAMVERLKRSTNVLYIGRGIFYGVAIEGALKLKEVAYIHSEGILTGELKHGSLALVDSVLPIIALIPSDHLSRKNLSSIEEIASRGGKVIAITNQDNDVPKLEELCDLVIRLPIPYNHLSPLPYSLFLQLVACKIAISKGLNVDKPRNLAKSVTVE